MWPPLHARRARILLIRRHLLKCVESEAREGALKKLASLLTCYLLLFAGPGPSPCAVAGSHFLAPCSVSWGYWLEPGVSPEPQEVPVSSRTWPSSLSMRRGLSQRSLSLTGWCLFGAQASDLERLCPVRSAFSSGMMSAPVKMLLLSRGGSLLVNCCSCCRVG